MSSGKKFLKENLTKEKIKIKKDYKMYLHFPEIYSWILLTYKNPIFRLITISATLICTVAEDTSMFTTTYLALAYTAHIKFSL